jgi:hypothetical protein
MSNLVDLIRFLGAMKTVDLLADGMIGPEKTTQQNLRG